MKRCSKCNKVYDDSWEVCFKCGKTLVDFSEKVEASAKVRKCSYCAEEILGKAIKCKHCGSLLDGRKKKKGVPVGEVLLGILSIFTIWFFVVPHIPGGNKVSSFLSELSTVSDALDTFQEASQIDLSGYTLAYTMDMGLATTDIDLGRALIVLSDKFDVGIVKEGAKVKVKVDTGKQKEGGFGKLYFFFDCDDENKVCLVTRGKGPTGFYPAEDSVQMFGSLLEMCHE